MASLATCMWREVWTGPLTKKRLRPLNVGGFSLQHQTASRSKNLRTWKSCFLCAIRFRLCEFSLPAGTLRLRRGLAGIDQLHHRAIITQLRAAAESGDRRKDVLERATPLCDRFQAEVLKKVSGAVFGFGDSVRHQEQPVSGIQMAVSALVSCV